VLKYDVNLLTARVIYNFKQAYNVGVTSFLQDGNFLLDLVFMTCIFTQPTALRIAIDDLDSDRGTSLEILAELDFSVYATPELVNDLVLVDDLAARDWVEIDISYVRLLRCLPLGKVQVRTGIAAIVYLLVRPKRRCSGIEETGAACWRVANSSGSGLHDISIDLLWQAHCRDMSSGMR
jgi:hypothetical protein